MGLFLLSSSLPLLLLLNLLSCQVHASDCDVPTEAATGLSSASFCSSALAT